MVSLDFGYERRKTYCRYNLFHFCASYSVNEKIFENEMYFVYSCHPPTPPPYKNLCSASYRDNYLLAHNDILPYTKRLKYFFINLI